jgi:hypothetical protein
MAIRQRNTIRRKANIMTTTHTIKVNRKDYPLIFVDEIVLARLATAISERLNSANFNSQDPGFADLLLTVAPALEDDKTVEYKVLEYPDGTKETRVKIRVALFDILKIVPAISILYLENRLDAAIAVQGDNAFIKKLKATISSAKADAIKFEKAVDGKHHKDGLEEELEHFVSLAFKPFQAAMALIEGDKIAIQPDRADEQPANAEPKPTDDDDLTVELPSTDDREEQITALKQELARLELVDNDPAYQEY